VTLAEQCEQIRLCRDRDERAGLLKALAADAEALPWLLGQARSAAASAPQESLPLADLAVELAEIREEPVASASAGRIRGQALRAMGQHAEAVAAFAAAAQAAQQAGDNRLAAQVQIGSVDSLGMLGRYEEAIALGRALEDRLRQAGAEEDAAKVLFNVGSLHFRRDQYARALECYQQAGAILERVGDETIRARVQSNCANALTHLGRIEEALALYAQAQAVFAEKQMTLEAAVVDTNSGYLHYVSGRYALAVAALARAHRVFEAQGREQEMARCDIDLAEAYRGLNLYPEAQTCYERALHVFARLPLDYDRARAELGRAAVCMALQQMPEALAGLERADALFKAQRNVLQRAHVRLMRAYLLRAQDESAGACQQARSAERAFRRNGLGGWAAEARFLVAETALEAGQNAVRTMQSVIRAARRHTRGWLECQAARALGRYYARQADLKRALRHLRAAASALEQARTLIAPEEMHVAFLRDKQAVYEDLVGALLARGRKQDIAEALEYVERSRSRLLLERIQAALRSQAASDPATRLAQDRQPRCAPRNSRRERRIRILTTGRPLSSSAREDGIRGTKQDDD
jgi:tetratricopeptide (TPR) repeat protein